jgi:hypothetical protein
MAASSSALMKNTAGCLICVVVVQTVLVFQQATGIALLPPPQTTSVLARSDAGLWQWHYYQQRIATTRKKLTRSAPNMATRSAYAMRCG